MNIYHSWIQTRFVPTFFEWRSVLALFVVICGLAAVNTGWAQTATDGDYRSRATGNWSGSGTWQVRSSGSWANTATPPTAANNVYIQSGHTVTVDSSTVACNDLHVHSGGGLTIGGNTIQVNGKWRSYTGTAVTSTGADGTFYSGQSGQTNPAGITSTGSGKMSIVGNSRNVTLAGENGANTENFTLEINLNANQTATFLTSIKPANCNIVQGTVDMSTFRLAVDGGSSGTGNLTLSSGTTLISGASGSGTGSIVGRSGSTPGGTLTVSSGATLRLTGSGPQIGMTTINFNGTVEYTASGAQTLAKADTASSGSVAPSPYTSLKLAGTSAKTLGVNATVNGTLTMGGTASLSLGAFALTYGASSTLEYAGTSGQTTAATEFPASGGPNGLTINNASGVTLAAGFTRTINGTVTMAAGSFTLGSGATLSYGASATLAYTGSSAQTTAGEFPSSSGPNNLTINNSAGVTLHAARTVGGTLTLTSGLLDTAANSATLTATSVSGGSSTSYVKGKLAQVYSATGSKTFPIGKNSNYRPLTLNYTALTGPSTVTAEQNDPGSAFGGSSPAVNVFTTRYWTVTQSGGSAFTYNITVDGTGFSPVGTAVILKYNTPTTTKLSTTFSSPNYTASGLTSFSDFALGDYNPTPKILVTLPGEASPNAGGATAQTAGTGFDITLTATTDGTTVNTSFNSTPNITFTGPAGSPTYPSTVSFSSGVGTAHITLTTAETTTITATDTSDSIAGIASSSLLVNPGAINSYVVSASSPQTTNTAFSVAVTAKDANNNTVTTDNSTVVTMTSSSGNVQFDSNGNGTFDDNTKQLSSGTFSISTIDSSTAAETVTVTATDANSKTGTSDNIVVNLLPKYRSRQNGDWNDFNTWQVDFGGGFANAVSGQTPSSLSDTIEIRNGHTVTVTASVAVDQVTVDSGGQLTVNSSQTLTVADGAGTDLDVSGIVNNAGTITPTGTIVFESGGKYQHNFTTGNGTIPTATWNTGSTCEIIGYTTGGPPTGTGQSFYNFIWNCPNQSSSINFAGALSAASGTSINGNFTVTSTGGRELRLTATASPTLAVGGDLIVQGGSLVLCTNSSGTASGSPTLNVAGNISVTSGALHFGQSSGTSTINASGNVSVSGGTLANTSGGGGPANFNFAKAGTQTFTSGGTIGGVISWTVNNGSTLDIGTSTVGGTGTFTVSSGGTLKGNGTVSVATTVNSGATITPGSSIGTITFAIPPNLSGTTLMEIDRAASPNADKIVVSSGTLTNAGTLTVNNIGATLTGGEVFDLFDASAFSGSFSTMNLPSLGSGLNWYTGNLTVDGTIKVNRAPTANNLSLACAKGGSTTFPLAKYASDADSDTLSATVGNFNNGGGGSFTSGTVTYTPASSFTGTETFDYTVSDSFGGSVIRTVTVTVTAATGSGGNILSMSGTYPNPITITFAGIPGATYHGQVSSDLDTWTDVDDDVVASATTGQGSFTDGSPPQDAGFYRTRYVSGP